MNRPPKTVLLSTRPVSKAEVQAVFPDEWHFIKPVLSAKYLGIPMGREVIVNDVYTEATKKLEQRVTAYMPHKSIYSTANRVLISNVFFVSLFAHLNRFFVMGEDNSDEVEALMGAELDSIHS